MTPDERIISLLDLFQNSGKIRFKKEFYDQTGISRQYMRMVEHEGRRFNSAQIKTICEKYNVNANWIFGLEDKLFRAS